MNSSVASRPRFTLIEVPAATGKERVANKFLVQQYDYQIQVNRLT